MAFPLGTLVPTLSGLVPLEQLQDCTFHAFDGRAYRPVRALAGATAPLQHTLLGCGLILRSDAAQRFRVAPAQRSAPLWLPQRAIKPRDRVLIPYKRYDCSLSLGALFVGKNYGGWAPSRALIEEPVFWHLIGYALADGYYPDSTNEADVFRVFTYDRNDIELLHGFEALCERHNIAAARSDGQHPMLSIFDPAFQRWLHDLGFRSMNEGVRLVPSRLFQTPAWIREAVLQGFFSCWGEWRAHSSVTHLIPHVLVTDSQLCQGILRLLWSVGIAASIEQTGWNRIGDIFILDIDGFQDRVDFLQARKRRPRVERRPDRAYRWDTLRHETTLHLTGLLREAPGWSAIGSDERERLLRHRYDKTCIRRPEAIRLCRLAGLSPPEWLDYHHARVDTMRTAADAVPMAELTTEGKKPFVADFALAD